MKRIGDGPEPRPAGHLLQEEPHQIAEPSSLSDSHKGPSSFMRAPDQLDAAPDLLPLRVLLIDDSEDDAYLLNRYLRRAGYDAVLRRVETAEAMQDELRDGNDNWDVV